MHDSVDFFSFDIYPLQSDSISTWCIKLLKMLLIIIVIMFYYSYSLKQIGLLFGIGILLIGILFLYVITIKKENFSQVPYKMDDGYTPISELSFPAPVTPIQSITMQPKHTEPFLQQTSPVEQFIQSSPINNATTPIENFVEKTSPVQQHTIQKQSFTTETIKPFQPSKSTMSLFSKEGQLPQEKQYQTSINLLRSEPKDDQDSFQRMKVNQPMKSKQYYTPDVGTNARMYQEPVMVAPRIMDPQFSSIRTQFSSDENPLQDFGGMSMPTRKTKRNTSMLFDRRNTEADVSEAQLHKERVYMRDIQPNMYSTTNERLPINSSVGISFTPQLPQLSRKTVRREDGRSYPLYSRIDPQLIRDDVPEERKEELPKREKWSEELPHPARGNPIYDIYDPRFTGYGDESRSYYDTDMGQIKYYYSDVDAYRRPNFVIRNKVDHVDFIDPMGKTWSEYPRTESLDDVTDQVNDDWLARSTEFREDIMEKLMRKNNAESWQTRFAPKSKGARLSTFTSGY